MMLLIPFMILLIISPYVYEHYVFHQNEIDEPVFNSIVLKLKKREERDSIYSRNTFFPREKRTPVKIESNKWSKKRFEQLKSNAKTRPFLSQFDINEADSNQLKQIKGIGPVLSARIIKYRELLGGFSTTQQLKEVYGLNDTVLMSLDTLGFVANGYQPSPLYINELNEFNLRKHPYISRAEAKAILNFKYQHGHFTSVSDLLKIHLLDSVKVKRLTPYLKFNTP